MRLPETHGDRRRAKDHRQSPPDWPPASDRGLMGRDFSFRRCRRISAGRDFAKFRLSKIRRRTRGFLLVLKTDGPSDRPRLAIVASRKVGNAVTRNLLRRRIREVFRQFIWGTEAQCDWLVLLRREARDLTYDDLVADFTAAASALLHVALHGQGSGPSPIGQSVGPPDGAESERST